VTGTTGRLHVFQVVRQIWYRAWEHGSRGHGSRDFVRAFVVAPATDWIAAPPVTLPTPDTDMLCCSSARSDWVLKREIQNEQEVIAKFVQALRPPSAKSTNDERRARGGCVSFKWPPLFCSCALYPLRLLCDGTLDSRLLASPGKDCASSPPLMTVDLPVRAHQFRHPCILVASRYD